MKKIVTFLIVLAIMGAVFIIPRQKETARGQTKQMPSTSSSDFAFKIDTNLTIDESAKVENNSLCDTVKQCVELGDELLESTLWKERMIKEEYRNQDSSDEIVHIEEGIQVARYDVDDNQFELDNKTDLSLEEEQIAADYLRIFFDIIPLEWRKDLQFFYVYRNSGFIAAIYNDYQHVTEQELFFDVNQNELLFTDFGEIGGKKYQLETMIHEFGHLFSLHYSQYESSDQTIETNQDNYLFGFSDESYLKRFYLSFWKDVSEAIINETEMEAKMADDFYGANKQNFVSTYASTNPDEDFAESFRYFVFTQVEDINPQNPADQKILFFYQFPELVGLRTQMIQALANQFH